MDLAMFGNDSPGDLVMITGSDPVMGSWEHLAFVPTPLTTEGPVLSAPTWRAVSDARAALAALDSTAQRLPNPTLLRNPTLRKEAQSTSALEGTYAPLADVLTADDDEPGSPEMREILNYVRMANYAFAWISDDRPLTPSLFSDLQGMLMTATPLESVSGRLRDEQVVIGRRADADPAVPPVKNARFVPTPPGQDLEAAVQQLADWMRADHSAAIDPVVSAAMTHYQFETLHPFRDGNGRLGRLLVVLDLFGSGVLTEPTLTVSPWFEARRSEYYDRLLAVSTNGDWDGFVRFFAQGLQGSADLTHRQMLSLVEVQKQLKEIVKASPLRADSAQSLVDFAVANTSFTVRQVERGLQVSYGRANALVGQLVELGILAEVPTSSLQRRFHAPRVLAVLVASA